MFEQQQAFNGAVVDHLNRNVPVQHASGASIDGGLTVLRGQLAELARFQTLLIVFLQQITPYVDTRDRDVAGLLRGLSGAIDAVSNEVLKRSEALLAHDRQHERRLSEMETELQDLRRRLAELQERLRMNDLSDSHRGKPSAALTVRRNPWRSRRFPPG